MSQRIVIVDAFASKPFTGNPAAVCLLADAAPDTWMHDVAAEMNLSETAFVVRLGDEFRLRWFTPTIEVDLCGHATLAAAHVLWESGELPEGAPARFHTRSGLLVATRHGDWIEMDFPSLPVVAAEPPAGLLEALDVTAGFTGRTRFDLFVEVEHDETVRTLAPDYARLKQVQTRGIIVTARSSASDCDFVSRFFAPGAGLDEDPVTGSAHCSLAPYWSQKLERDTLTGYQASRRGGFVRTTVRGDRVILAGQAITTVRGELLSAPV